METRKAYNLWAEQYDTNKNKTRDLEGQALRKCLDDVHFEHCLEIGCGTGKNTEWLAQKARTVTAVDLSEEMLAKAQLKITSDRVQFKQADINLEWDFRNSGIYDLVSFSLVLEHIENLEHVFKEACKSLRPGGLLYVGELHPFKQYQGTKARFDTDEGRQIVDCYTHHISDFVKAANMQGLKLKSLDEFFDTDEADDVPRILTLLFQSSVANL